MYLHVARLWIPNFIDFMYEMTSKQFIYWKKVCFNNLVTIRNLFMY